MARRRVRRRCPSTITFTLGSPYITVAYRRTVISSRRVTLANLAEEFEDTVAALELDGMAGDFVCRIE